MREQFAKKTLRKIGKLFGYQFIDTAVPSDICAALIKYKEGGEAIGLSRENDLLAYILRHFDESRAQIFQDLFVLFQTDEKRDGYFVEFGATNGLTHSNSWLLESKFGWRGILAEPAVQWHEKLRKNRNCTIETKCVWTQTGEQLGFNEYEGVGLSTIDLQPNLEKHATSSLRLKKYMVETISLNDLLEIHNAPAHIDYLSVDTEGSEFEILSHFNFSRRDIRIITVEHNYNTAQRQKIHALLTAEGYMRIFEGFSRWDDWFVKAK